MLSAVGNLGQFEAVVLVEELAAVDGAVVVVQEPAAVDRAVCVAAHDSASFLAQAWACSSTWRDGLEHIISIEIPNPICPWTFKAVILAISVTACVWNVWEKGQRSGETTISIKASRCQLGT